jgi:hypothetical protein
MAISSGYTWVVIIPSAPTLNKGVQNGSDDDDDDYEEEMAGYAPVTDPTRADGDPYPLVDPSEAERHPRDQRRTGHEGLP